MARGAAAPALDDDRKGLGSWPANVPTTGFSTACPRGKDPRAPVRMAAIRETVLERLCRNQSLCAPLVGTNSGAAAVENSLPV